MIDTYNTAADAQADRRQQQALLAALAAADRALRRDECGAWHIGGSRGSIHTWGDGRSWVLFVSCRSALHWTHTKRKLAICTVTQDGDDEGCLRLHQLPTPEQAAVIREALGIPKRRTITDEIRQRLKAYGFKQMPRREAAPAWNFWRERARAGGSAGPASQPKKTGELTNLEMVTQHER